MQVSSCHHYLFLSCFEHIYLSHKPVCLDTMSQMMKYHTFSYSHLQRMEIESMEAGMWRITHQWNWILHCCTHHTICPFLLKHEQTFIWKKEYFNTQLEWNLLCENTFLSKYRWVLWSRLDPIHEYVGLCRYESEGVHSATNIFQICNSWGPIFL